MANPRDISPIDIRIGKALRALRKQKGATQQGLGRLLGVSFQQVQKYETGQNRLSVARLLQVASALRFDPAEFVTNLKRDYIDV